MSEGCELELRRGALHVTRADADRFLDGVEALVLVRDGQALLIVPVRQAHAGGYLLKRRNLAGDRSAHVAGFLRDQGVPDEPGGRHRAEWSEERSALIIADFFPTVAANQLCMMHSD
jgi:hypothetical protein